MANDTTQFIVDLQRAQKKQSTFSDLEGATPLVKDATGNWIDAPIITGKGDFLDAEPITPDAEYGDGQLSLVVKDMNNVPKQPESIPDTLIDYFKDGRSEGWTSIIRGGVGGAIARGEISVEEGLEQGNEEILQYQKSIGELENINFWKEPTRAVVRELGSLSVFQEQIIKEAATHALAFGSIAIIITALTGGVAAPLVPVAVAAGGTYGVIKKTIDIEGMNLFVDMLEDGIDKTTALTLALGAGLAIGATELFQLKLFTIGFKRKFLKALFSKESKSALLEMGKTWVKISGLEVAQELIQESIGIGAKFIASVIENNPNAMPTWKEMREDYKKILSPEFITAMLLLASPSAVSVGVQVRAQKKKEAFVKLQKEIDEKAAKAAEKKAKEKVSEEEKLQKAVKELRGLPPVKKVEQKKLKLKEVKVKKPPTEKQKFQKEKLEELAKDSKPLVTREEKQRGIGEKATTLDRVKNNFTRAFNVAKRIRLAIKPMDVVFDVLDGTKNYKGANFRIFKRTTDKSYAKYLLQKDIILDKGLIMADKLKLNDNDMEAIGVWATLKQKGGKIKLKATGFTADKLNVFLDRGLTENQNKLYNLMREELDKLKPQILKTMKEVYGKDFQAVENYFPFMADFEKMNDFEIQNMFGDDVEFVGLVKQEGKFKQDVNSSFTIERKFGNLKIKIDAMDVFSRHIDNAAYLINLGADIKSLGELAKTEKYRNLVGDLGQEIVNSWIDLMARRGGVEGHRSNVLDTIRRNIGFAVLGYKLSTIMIQPTALMDGAALIGHYAFKGAKNVVLSAEWRTFLKDNFIELQARIADDPAFAEFMNNKAGKGIIGKVRRGSFWGIRKVDGITASAVAAGAYEKIVTEKGMKVDFNKPDLEAITDAELIVRRTQSSGQFKDAPAVISQGRFTGNVSLDKIIFQFQSFMLGRWSLIQHDMIYKGIKLGKTQESLNIATWLIAALIAEVLLRRGAEELIALFTGDDPDEPLEDIFFEKLMGEALRTVPFVSQLTSGFMYGTTPVPAISLANEAFKRAKFAINTKDDRKKLIQAARAIVILSGEIGGIPGTTQIDQIIRSVTKKKKRKLSRRF